jgi:hypothetical protein
MTDEGEKVGFSRARLIAHPGHERETHNLLRPIHAFLFQLESHTSLHTKIPTPPSIKFMFLWMVSPKEKKFIIEYWRGQDSYPARGQK